MQRAVTRDDVLRKHYARTSHAVDGIVGDPELLAKFIDLVNADLPQSELNLNNSSLGSLT